VDIQAQLIIVAKVNHARIAELLASDKEALTRLIKKQDQPVEVG